ncbi:phosphomannomutase/phosphoglucomutase [Saccharophagus degradans]|uniref:phosphomannomutase/phosphoglucomutase n=1 Tax=Saccharophagus degradans TaxID=86304 RepID=UPI0024781658|nr:phosphomannomutase/phosphoglucomutase [Saccharophagus degradans]WGO98885.1 phosphomannomutase/phosphoglucomutase [Saccharophagus degradans]
MLPKPSRANLEDGSSVKGKSVKAKKTSKASPVVIAVSIALAVAAIIVGGVGFAAYKFLVVDVQEKQLIKLTEQRSAIVAENLKIYIDSVYQQVDFFARKPSLASALASNEEVALKDIEAQILKQINNVESAQAFPKGSAKLDAEAPFPIRFAELEQIRLAEEREAVLPEFANINKQWLLSYAVAVPSVSDLPAHGTLLLRFNIDGVKRAIGEENVQFGRATLIQKIPGVQDRNVFVVGQGGEGRAEPAAVEGTYWHIVFEPSPLMRAQASVDATLIYIGIGALAAICFLTAVLLGRRIGLRMVAKAETQAVNVSLGLKPDAVAPSVPQDILDIEISDEDEALLGLEDEETATAGSASLADIPEQTEDVDDSLLPNVIFRAYDIRGLAKTEITKEIAQQIGQAVASEALDAGETTLIVARDARTHSPELTEYLIRGILSTGCDVMNIGTVPTPLLYFATETLDCGKSGIMVTASHNPAEYNGFKVVINGKCRAEEDIKAIRARILSKNLYEGAGEEKRHDIVPNYIDTIFSDVALAGDISIVIDAANGVTGKVAPQLFEELGCGVVPLFCDLDGTFPNHDPDPTIVKNLQPLIAKVRETNADLGVAFDGDGDRLVVVTPKGKIIWPDRLLMLFAKDIVSRNPGADVVFDVKSTRALNQCITDYGGRPILWKTGHSPMKGKMLETGALLGGEYSGHIFIKDRWFGFDDGMYAAARLIEIISLQGETLDEIIGEFPELISTTEVRVDVAEDKKFKLIENLIQNGDFGEAKLTTLDGLRADFKDGWGLVRGSNTSASITLRFEAENEEFLHFIKALFVRELRKVDNTIVVDWEQ